MEVLCSAESIVVYMKNTFAEYIDEKMGEELMMTFSLDEIQEDWNITLSELFYALSCLPRYHIKKHPDYNWHLVFINKGKARAIAERKKDKSHL